MIGITLEEVLVTSKDVGTIRMVAVKALRFEFPADGDQNNRTTTKMLRRELGIWRRLAHNNVVPFLGIAYGFGMRNAMSLVSLWMPNHSLHAFLGKHDNNLGSEDRLQLLLDIANGLHYLHSIPIVHGDLSSSNVLIDADYNACLADFGHASLVENVPEALNYLQRSTGRPGALRWSAPEQIDPEGEYAPTTRSDIYSFGCVGLHVLSGKLPWSEVKNDAAVVRHLSSGHKPGRPAYRKIEGAHWNFLQHCWSSAERRPTMGQIIATIQQFKNYFLQPRSLRDLLTPQSTRADSLMAESPPSLPLPVMEDLRRNGDVDIADKDNQESPVIHAAYIQHPVTGSLQEKPISLSHSLQPHSLSISTDDGRPSSYPLRTKCYPDNDCLPVIRELSPDSPLERSEYPEVLLPPVSYSSAPVNNSLDSWLNHSLALQRPHTSHFSRWYNVSVPEDEPINAVSSANLFPPPLAFDRYPLPMLDDRQNASLDYYMKHVLRMQYLHASESLDSIIWRLIHTSDNARHAACLLSDLHRKSTQKDRLGLIEPEDVETLSRMSMVTFQSPLTEGDASAGLCSISYFLFSGGKGQLQTFLDAVCTYSLSVLHDPRYGGPGRVLLHCPESLRFIIKTSMWYDVLASTTLVREPRFLAVIRDLFCQESAFFDGVPAIPLAEYSMMSVMGCENHIVFALAEIASLAHWKEVHVKAGSLGVIELVKRGRKIEEILKKPSSYPYEPDMAIDPAEQLRTHQRRLTSEVFRTSARVYLQSVVSGDFPRCPEIIEAVNDTVKSLMSAEDGPTGRAVVRSVVFSICICGCLTEDRRHQRYFLKRLQEQQGLSIGITQQVSYLIQEIWKRRSRGAVDWRQVMREAGMLLV